MCEDIEVKYIDCDECNGNGTVEEMDCRTGSASLCCGGCVKDVCCERCNGTGELGVCKYTYETYGEIDIIE